MHDGVAGPGAAAAVELAQAPELAGAPGDQLGARASQRVKGTRRSLQRNAPNKVFRVNALRVVASSSARQAPWPRVGVITWAASPSSSRPRT